MKSIKARRPGAIMLAAGISILALATAGAKAADIKIGAPLALTGANADESKKQQVTWKMWLDKVNAAGGINVGGTKSKVQLIEYDYQSDGQRAAQLAEKLITSDKVDVLLSPFGSGHTKIVATIAQRYQTPLIACAASSESVFDQSFNLVPGGFTDPKIPAGFAPFGVQALGGNIFVTYAKQDAAKKDDVALPGQGYVDEFSPAGALIAQVVNSQKKNAPLNAAWGLALAPADFSVFGGDLLVGNFGNGRISAYTQQGAKWVYKGQLRHADGSPIELDGLWAIAFGNGAAAGPAGTLYFLSGPGQEAHGLFGSITAG